MTKKPEFEDRHPSEFTSLSHEFLVGQQNKLKLHLQTIDDALKGSTPKKKGHTELTNHRQRVLRKIAHIDKIRELKGS